MGFTFPPLPPEVRAQQDLLQMQAMQAYMQAMHREAAMPDGLNNAWGCNPYFLPCHPYSPWPGTNPWDYGVQTKHAHAETGRGGGTELLLAQSLGPNPPFTEGPATSDEIPSSRWLKKTKQDARRAEFFWRVQFHSWEPSGINHQWWHFPIFHFSLVFNTYLLVCCSHCSFNVSSTTCCASNNGVFCKKK